MARIAAGQRGLITRAQLLASGLGRGAIEHRLANGRLHPFAHRGVYLVGHPAPSPLAAELAAVLAFAGHAALGHGSALALWELIDELPATVSVTTVERDRRSRPGLRVYRVAWLRPGDVRRRQGLPVTSPAVSLIDVASEVPTTELERLVAEARMRGLLRSGELEAALVRAGRRRGTGPVRALLAAECGPAFTRGELEQRLLELVRSAGLPAPIVNGRVIGYEVDFHWPAHRLVVETDGRRFHNHPRAFEQDRRRDQMLVAAGWRVIRITWRQLTTEPLAVLARLAMALGAAAA